MYCVNPVTYLRKCTMHGTTGPKCLLKYICLSHERLLLSDFRIFSLRQCCCNTSSEQLFTDADASVQSANYASCSYTEHLQKSHHLCTILNHYVRMLFTN